MSKPHVITYPTPPSLLPKPACDAIIFGRKVVAPNADIAANMDALIAAAGYTYDTNYGWSPAVMPEFELIRGEGDWVAEIRLAQTRGKHQEAAGRLLVVVAGVNVHSGSNNGPVRVQLTSFVPGDVYDDDHAGARIFSAVLENADTMVNGRSLTMNGWMSLAYAYSPGTTVDRIIDGECACRAEGFAEPHFHAPYLPPKTWAELLPAPVEITLRPLRSVEVSS